MKIGVTVTTHQGEAMKGSQFKPAWWLKSSHLQTMWPVLCRRDIKNLSIERQRVELPDGDFIDLDWVNRDLKGTPIVLILHGLEGSIDSHYAKGMLLKMSEQGWRGVFMHFRGCSGEPNRLSRGYHSGETGDVDYVINWLRKKEASTHLAVLGFSLGGNVLLKWLGETGKDNPLTAAIAVSVPFELHKAAEHIQKGFSQFYQWYFIRCLRERMTAKFKACQCKLDPEIFYEVNTMYEYDDKITAPLEGFTNADEYYNIASSRQYLRNIHVPTLIVHAKDDPFMSEDVIPSPDELSPTITLEVTENGGHVGFVSGHLPWRPRYWLEDRVPAFLVEYFNN